MNNGTFAARRLVMMSRLAKFQKDVPSYVGLDRCCGRARGHSDSFRGLIPGLLFWPRPQMVLVKKVGGC